VTLIRSRGALAAATAVLALTLTACGSGDAQDSASAATGGSTAASSSSSAAESPAMGSTTDQPFGDGCSAVPTSGAGSFEGMAQDPVATAASNNPALSTLVKAVTAANLVDTLNSAQDITVLAPADPAFEGVPADALKALLADKAQLTAVLTHHVIEGRLSPDQLAGEHTTLNGDMVTIEGSGEDFTIAGDQTVLGKADAGVICGNVQTANATVYIIDQVLAPPAS
jgi:uncharacterized surface protein with fasciclin (FAS1) repeats